MPKELSFQDGKIERHYTDKWLHSGIVNMDELPTLIASVVAQRKEMVAYIEALYDKIDWILEKNRCCDMEGCLTAGCTSDHK